MLTSDEWQQLSESLPPCRRIDDHTIIVRMDYQLDAFEVINFIYCIPSVLLDRCASVRYEGSQQDGRTRWGRFHVTWKGEDA